jgi:ankyrin repeat protein
MAENPRAIDMLGIADDASDAEYLAAFKAHAVSVSFGDGEVLFQDINDRDSEGDSLLHIASIMGGLRAVKLLVFAGATVNALGDMDKLALHYAACSQFFDIAEFLLKAGSTQSKDAFGYTPMEWAQQMDDQEMIVLLGQFAVN